MRRVIAEDQSWNLETVPPLVDACIRHIAQNFHGMLMLSMASCLHCTLTSLSAKPILDELQPVHKIKVLKQLPADVPLKTTAPLISDEGYWERCCRLRWELCDVSEHRQCWKEMYFEKNAQEAIEKFVPGNSDLNELEELLRLSSDYVKCLIIRQLLPPLQDKPLTVDEEEDG